MKKLVISCLASAAALTLAQADDARALPFGFYVIENNATEVIEDQLFMDVTDQGSGAILFQFQNLGPLASSITDIYFDYYDGILNFSNFVYYLGDTVAFDTPAAPPNLPGGSPYSFTEDFSADSDSPIVQNGVNPGERLGILFNSLNFDQVIAHINDRTIRVGLHVQGIGPEGQYSESFINNPNPVPEPATVMLVGSGLVAFPLIRRRFGKK